MLLPGEVLANMWLSKNLLRALEDDASKYNIVDNMANKMKAFLDSHALTKKNKATKGLFGHLGMHAKLYGDDISPRYLFQINNKLYYSIAASNKLAIMGFPKVKE